MTIWSHWASCNTRRCPCELEATHALPCRAHATLLTKCAASELWIFRPDAPPLPVAPAHMANHTSLLQQSVTLCNAYTDATQHAFSLLTTERHLASAQHTDDVKHCKPDNSLLEATDLFASVFQLWLLPCRRTAFSVYAYVLADNVPVTCSNRECRNKPRDDRDLSIETEIRWKII